MVDSLKAVLRGECLGRQGASSVMNKILSGDVAPEQIGALLIALQCKQESIEEIVGFTQAVRLKSRTVDTGRIDLVDTCGTGGDGASTFNISTTVAFVVAAAGQPIAKHGNRAVSSRSGSFDVLETLGVPLLSEASDIVASIDQHGIGFMFAPSFHPALKDLARLRKNLGVRTVFNLLGPLLNPAGVKRQLIGVFADPLVEKVAEVLKELGTEEAMVVRGEDGLDEITICGATRIAHLKDGKVITFIVTPEEFGFRRAHADEIAGGDAAQNARILRDTLAGTKGAQRDVVVFNAAAALIVGGKASRFREGIALASEAIDNGRAREILDQVCNQSVQNTQTVRSSQGSKT